MQPLLERVRGGEIVIGDGAWGTQLMARELRQCSTLPVAIQANAGLPENRDGEVVFPETPELMAAHARQLVHLGVSIIGGCSGTGPDHIRALRRMVDEITGG